MERIEVLRKIRGLLERYKYALIILCVGILFMLIPERHDVQPQPELPVMEAAQSRTQELEEVLAQIEGVGKVKVLLTELSSEQRIYQTDEDRSLAEHSERVRVETVIVTNSEREEIGLVSTVKGPVYRGAIVVCQGGDCSHVKLSVVQAVSSVTGISSDRIVVLKMK